MVAVLFYLFISLTHAAADSFIVFEPIPARSTSTVKEWTDLGLSQRAAEAVHQYATNPSPATALGVLQHYNDFAGDKNQATKYKKMREACFAKDKQLFQTVDAMKYEVVMRTQKRLAERFKDQGGVGSALRVGSTAARHKEWLDWAKTRDMESMPSLDSNKQFSSDDDVTNFPKPGAEEKNPVLSELLNGKTAAEEFIQASRDLGFTDGLDPKLVQIEFLSPTKAFDILRTKHPSEFIPVKPTFMNEWTSSDQEKYNGLFAVEQLHKWAVDKGMITTDVNNPEGSTISFAHYANTSKDPNAPRGFSSEGLMAWMANNHRQIFEVHSGDLKSLAKYTTRMIAAWQTLGLTPPGGFSAMYDMAEKIYNPPSKDYSPPADALDQLQKYNKTLIISAHEQNFGLIRDRLTKAIQARSANRPTAQGLNFESFDIHTLLGSDPELRKAVNSLAVAYTNISPDMVQELEIEIGKTLKQADPETPQSQYDAHLSTFLLQTLEVAKTSAATSRTHTDAFTYLRTELDKQINDHITDINKRLNLDEYLLKVAMGDFSDKQLRIEWDGWRPRVAKRQLTPKDVADDMRMLESFSRLFVWEEAPLATRAKEYFEAGDPGLAVRMVMLIREMGEVQSAKPVIITYTDADGNTVTKELHTTQFQKGARAGMNAAFLGFKATLAGWKIWGDAADGKALFENLKKLTSKAGMDPKELAIIQSQILANAINLSEYANVNLPAGSYLATMATLSGNSFMDDNLYTELGKVLLNDLTVAYQPYLAYAYAAHGIASWGWNKYSLSASKGEIFKLLLENGDWVYFDKDGKETKDPKKRDPAKDPKLVGYEVWDGESNKYMEKDLKQLAKLLPEKAPNGIMLKKSKTKVNPRLSLMDIAYKSGYVDKDKMIDIDTKAITGVFGGWSVTNLPSIISLPIITFGSSYWTKEWLESTYGILVPTREDATKLAPKGHAKKKERWVQIASGSQQGWGTWAASWVDGVRFGTLKTLGYLMQDFWVKRQLLLEKVVLPEILKEAAKQKMKEDVQNAGTDDYMDELDKLKKRMIELDKKVWGKIARSADPFIGPKYNPETDIPITDHWWENIKPLRETLEKCVTWIEKNENNKDADPTVEFPEPYLNIIKAYYQIKSALGYDVVVKTKDDVHKLAKLNIGQITDVLLEYEKTYDNTLKILDSTQKLVKKKGSLDIEPFHVHLKPLPVSWLTGQALPSDGSENISDPNAVGSVAEDWQDKWKSEQNRVSADISAILIKMGFKPPKIPDSAYDWTDPIRKITGQLYNWYSSSQGDLNIVPDHPLYGDCLQLRLQIHKLQNMKAKVGEVSKDEFSKPIKQMVFKEVQKDDKGNDTLKDVPVDVKPGATPADRGPQIEKLITDMEEDYQDLLKLVSELFNVQLDVSPTAGYHLAGEIAVSVTATPKLQSVGSGDLAKQITGYRYEIYGLEPGVSEGDLIVDQVIKEKTWKHHLSAAGKQKIKVQILGKDNLPLSIKETDPITADPATLTGELIVHGDFSGIPPFTVEFGKDPALEHVVGTVDKAGIFSLEVKRINDKLFDPPKDGEKIKPFMAGGQIIYQVNQMSMVRTYGMTYTPSPSVVAKKSPITLSGSIFKLDKPLEITLPTTVTINVNVTDSSGKEVTADISAHSKMQSVSTPNNLILRLMDQDPVWVMAKRTDPAVSDKSKEVLFDYATMQTEMSFDIKLPFFETGNLTVEGQFVPAAGIDPKPVLTDGSMRSNFSQEQPVGADGSFKFTNDSAVLLSRPLTIYGLLYSDDKRMFKPKGGAFTTALKEGELLNVGTIEVEPYEVKIDPITIRVEDESGRALPESNLKVFIGNDAASWKNGVFVGSWIIKRKGERVGIRAELTLPDGRTVSNAPNSVTLSSDQFNLLVNPKPPAPLTVTLPVQLALDIEGVSAILLPQGKKKPEKIKISCPPPGANEWFDLEAPFHITCQGPFKVGDTITMSGKSQRSGDPVLYEGSKDAPVTEKSLVNIGTLTVQSKQKKDFVSITDMKAVSHTGAGNPVMGKPMKASAVVTVGDYEGPLLTEWHRLSDSFTDRKFIAFINKGQTFTAPSDMPALPRGVRLKDDVIELRVSDEIDHEARELLAFSWEMADEFKGFRYASVKKGKVGTQFVIGEQISVTGSWLIAEENGSQRLIIYYAGGSEFFREDVVVSEGAPFQHSAILDTKGLTKGKVDIRADLINIDPAATGTGIGKLFLKEAKDSIVSAGAAAASGSQSSGKNFTQGDQLFVNAVVKAAEGKDGTRMLQLEYRGKTVLAENFDMQGDERVAKSFQINTGKLDARSHTFTVTLFDDEGKRQDREIVRIKLAEKQTSGGAGQGGLQNVTCTGDTVSIKVWDHGAQDGDVVTLTMGGNTVLGGFNMGDSDNKIPGCGGTEPMGPPCGFMGLPLPAGTKVPITVTAHNEGTASPNTASLKVEGGCTPELQHWGLKTGQSASIYVIKGTAPPQNQQASGQPGTGQAGQGGQTQSTPIQSWP